MLGFEANGKVRLRIAELQAKVVGARFGQPTTGSKSPRAGAAALISIASWAAHHLPET